MTASGLLPDSLARGGSSTFALGVLSVGLGFIGSVVIARALNPSAKGSYDLAIACASLTATVIGLSLSSGTVLAVARGLANPHRLLMVLLGFATVQVGLAFAFLTYVSHGPLASAILPANPTPLTIAMIALLVGATSSFGYARSSLIGLQQIVSANWRDAWGRATTLALVMAAVALGGLLHYTPTPMLILGITVVGGVLSSVFMIHAVSRVKSPSRPGIGLRRVLGFAGQLHAANLVQFLNYRLDLFLVAALVDLRQVGLYALAVALGQLLWITANSAAMVLLPKVASSPHATGAAAAAQLTRMTLFVAAVGAAILGPVASPLVEIVYGREYAEAVPALLVLLPGIVAFVVVKVLASFIVGSGRLRANLIISVIGLCATIPLNITLIPHFGAVGAALASTVSYVISAILTVVWSARVGALPARQFLLVQRADLTTVANAVRGGMA